MTQNYGLIRPTQASAIRTLAAVLGEEEAARRWRTAAERAGVRSGEPDLDELHRIAEAIRAEGGPAATCAMSLQIRISTYRSLTRRSTPMSDPADPVDVLRRPSRLREIDRLGLASAGRDPVLKAFAARAAERLGLPIGLVSIVLDDAQVFAAHHGLEGWMAEVGGTPVEWSFCRNAVESGEPFVVNDARDHALVRDNPLVHNDGIRCYAGVPLTTSEGETLGTICVIGNTARTFSEKELDVLRELAADVVGHLESRAATAR